MTREMDEPRTQELMKNIDKANAEIADIGLMMSRLEGLLRELKTFVNDIEKAAVTGRGIDRPE